ncbi:MAG TPA: DUF3551 domain-containing protein [Pseudolabrys sp.]|jgi:hypothetical protein|nr:DUF3551 domain-containing protein [Pseudolabrys sp.]
MRKILALIGVLSAFALAAPAASAAGMSGSGSMSGKYCLNGPGTTKNCSFQTMASCEKAKKGSQTCAANTATTGSGSSMGKSSSGSKKY